MAAELRKCAACAQPFIAKTAKARFCSATCRSRNHRGQVVPLRAVDAPDAERSERPAALGRLEASTLKALQDAQRDESPLGIAVLELARTIDSPDTPASPKANLTREFRATLAEALKGAAAASGVDELRRRRDERRTG